MGNADDTETPTFRLSSHSRELDGFLKVDLFNFNYRNWEQTKDVPLARYNIHRGDAVAGLLHWVNGAGPNQDLLILVKQFRFSTVLRPSDGVPDPRSTDLPHPTGQPVVPKGGQGIWRTPRDGWQIELMAGMRNGDEEWIDTLIRETREETKLNLNVSQDDVQYINSFYPSMGACSERIHLYYACVKPHGGTLEEKAGVNDEEILIVTMTPAEFLDAVANNEIVDAKANAAAEWMRRPENRDTFTPPIA